ncbi:MAG: hypothetical protein ABS88_01325 [Sphingopyxis sp. SCN 67-31]|nr:MAG: hypothetical protein ABS88_01325 [Sphingopyxis sp. SCN 67-31]
MIEQILEGCQVPRPGVAELDLNDEFVASIGCAGLHAPWHRRIKVSGEVFLIGRFKSDAIREFFREHQVDRGEDRDVQLICVAIQGGTCTNTGDISTTGTAGRMRHL